MFYQYRILVSLLLLCLWCNGLWGQNQGVLKGTVFVEHEVATGATVQIASQNLYALTDQDGQFLIGGIPFGEYRLEISYVGAETKDLIVVIDQQEVNKNIELSTDPNVLKEVEVTARSASAELQRQPITINSIAVKSLRAQSDGVAEILKRSTGVLIRRSGGVGSNTQVNLNGLTGNAVRIYYDGMPLEYYGGGIELNNLPVNLIERVDIYKGVMPIDIGTDALGGGINIVPRKSLSDFLEATYELGSFNTHKATFNGLKKLHQHLYVGVNAFANYSDNDYQMRDIPNQSALIFENQFGNLDTIIQESVIDARRFHNQHFSTYGEAFLGVFGKPFADRLEFSTAYAYRFDEIQHGRQITRRPSAEATLRRKSWINRLKYRKQLLPEWQLQYTGILTFTEETAMDSTNLLYDWEGNVLPIANNRGSEVLSRPTGRIGDHLGTSHRLSSSYQFTRKHTLNFSNFYAFAKIQGNDPYGVRLSLEDEQIDPNTIPSEFSKNIAGIEMASKWLEKRLATTLFYKNYFYRANSIDITNPNVDRVPTRNNTGSEHGYGLGLKYNFLENFFARINYERTTRIPTEEEIFGNFLFIIPNYNIAPELSDNLNLGIFLKKSWQEDQYFSVDLNTFLRRQSDLIRLEISGGGEVAQYINEEEADALGIELNLKTRPIKNLEINTNTTLQKVTLAAADIIQNESFIGVQIPNIPRFFFNSTVRYELPSLFTKSDRLTLFWNYQHVQRFSITYVQDLDRANPDNIVPTQDQHDLGFTYTPPKENFQFSAQVNNVLDARVFDNFRVPKPGVHFLIKINYNL